jgi:hypothetical protein
MYIIQNHTGGKFMAMNSRKMNNYSLMRVSTIFVLVFAMVLSTFSVPFGPRISAEPIDNNPPNIPSNPTPANGSTDVSVEIQLNWTGGDPDGDPVTYNVYFGTTNPPVMVTENQSTTIYDPDPMYYWMIIAWDNQSASSEGPLWMFTTEAQPNNPPNTPDNEYPANSATDVAIDVTLTWEGGDPDSGDIVTYDVYFGTSSPPPKVASNQSNSSYTPESLDYSTVYYWKIVAWDDHGASTLGPGWHFTTMTEGVLSVVITKPVENMFYFQDQEKMPLGQNTIIYGPITIVANASAPSGIEKVEFYIDDVLKDTVTQEPYSYLWHPFIQFNGLSLKHRIKVVAYDNLGNNASAELNVTKWRFHILPWAVAGLAVASKLLLHTTVRGLIFNLKESRIAVTFYAIRTHYTTKGPFKSARGVINFKSCTGGMLIGPSKLTRFGPFHKFAYGTFTVLGNVHSDSGGIGRALISRLLTRGDTQNTGLLKNLLQ